MEHYDHKKIEKKWQKKWDAEKLYAFRDDPKKEKFYVLDMFPYPSGEGLHMGHTESYTSTDIFYRYKRMNGFSVLHPQGFDAFGLPAENFAIKTGTHPKETTKKNIANYIKQMKSLGLGYDFDRVATTSTPEYYKWTQWIFTKFFEKGLVYKQTDTVNWCDSCKTILANEQVEDGHCERCKNEVVQKQIPAWFFKITDFANELIDGLGNLDWPEHTKKNQVNWIGRSEGAEIDFEIKGTGEKLKVFTTRPDTLYGATYCVLAPEHELVEKLSKQMENKKEVDAYIKETQKKSEMERLEAKEKTGVELVGVKAINPANKEEIPVFIADYVLGRYGTGAIMAVPAHDERDYEFATKFGLPSKQVIEPVLVQTTGSATFRKDETVQDSQGIIALVKHWKEDKYAGLYWPSAEWGTLLTGGIDEGMTPEDTVLKEIREETGYTNAEITRSLGVIHSKYYHEPKKLNRFGHAPTFVVELKSDIRIDVSKEEKAKHELRWLTKDELRTFLTATSHLQALALLDMPVYTGTGLITGSGKFNGMDSEEAKKKITESVGGKVTTNFRLRDWSISRQRYWGTPIPIVYDPEGNAHAVPEEHLPWTLPEDVDFVPTGTAPLAKSEELKSRTEGIFGKGWTPEVDTMDTFVCSSWYYLRYPDPHNDKEFCSQELLKRWLPVDLYIGGAEHTYMHLLYARFFARALHRLGFIDFDEPFIRLKHQGFVLDAHGEKMSKSKGNVVNPDDMVVRFGADAVRMYMMFAGPLEDEIMWNENGIVGVYRFLERVWKMSTTLSDQTSPGVEREIHRMVKGVGEDIEVLKYNTAIAKMMTLVNVIKDGVIAKAEYEMLVRALAPFAPHITEELWADMGHNASIHLADWPAYDEAKLVSDTVTIVVQINGKLRDQIECSSTATEADIVEAARGREQVEKWIEGKKVKKVVYVPGRLINMVVEGP